MALDTPFVLCTIAVGAFSNENDHTWISQAIPGSIQLVAGLFSGENPQTTQSSERTTNCPVLRQLAVR